MDRTFLAGGAVLLVAFSAAAEVRDLDPRCVMRPNGADFGPGEHCGDSPSPHSRTVYVVNVAASTGTGSLIAVNNITVISGEDAAERPSRGFHVESFGPVGPDHASVLQRSPRFVVEDGVPRQLVQEAAPRDSLIARSTDA